ncbi:MAG: TonB-dependent receptor [Halioglobus sp.]
MIKSRKRPISALILSGATLLSLSPSAAFAKENSLVLEEVIVTARKRAESLQDAPLAVSALSGQTLLDAGISNLADITELVPNLQISRPSRDASIYIRGVGPTRGATNVTELSVGVYLDDVFLLKPHGQMMDLAEVESVQVLRGPQGTLFGKNTTGGAMVVTTVKPVEEFGGFGQVTAGNDGRLNAQASVDVPITDSFLTKLTVTSAEADGIGQDPVHGTELSDEDRKGVSLQLRWLASDDVTADFSFIHSRIRENLLAQGDCVVTNPDAQIPGRQLITPVSGFDLITDFCERASDSVATYHDPDKKFELDASQASMNIEWDINDNHSFRSITAWRYQETPNITYTNTYAGFPAGQESLKDGDSTQISQEFHFSGELLDSSVRYTTGLYFMRDDSDTGLTATWNGERGVWGSNLGELGVDPGTVYVLANYNEAGQANENDTYAFFTQWSWDMTDNLELTAGLRYGYEQRSLETERTLALQGESYADVPGATIIPGVAAIMDYDTFYGSALSALPLPLGDTERLKEDKDFESFTPMLSAAYHFPTEKLGDSISGLMMYASYTGGYKAGGFSDFAVGELIPFEEEEINSIELGVKLDAWNNRFRLNAALFSMDYDDMQLFVARPDPDPNNVGSLQGVTNAGSARIDGLEIEMTLLPAEGWLISLAASLADGEFEEFDDFIIDPESGLVVPLDRSDEDLPSLPESSYSLGVQYDWDTSFGSWTARADAFYRNEIYWGFDALTWDVPLARQESTTESYTVYNARLNWRITENWAVTAWGKNLSDKTYYDGGVGETANIGHVIKSYATPRRYGIDVRFDF